MLIDVLNSLTTFAVTNAGGLAAIGAGVAMIGVAGAGIGEGIASAKAIEGLMRTPELEGKLRSMMILSIALIETTAIYAFVIALLIVFVVI